MFESLGSMRESGRLAVPVISDLTDPAAHVTAAAAEVVPLGWRDDVPDLLHVADVLVQNVGGPSLTEALVAGLRAVTYRPLPGHGRADAAVLDAAGLAP